MTWPSLSLRFIHLRWEFFFPQTVLAALCRTVRGSCPHRWKWKWSLSDRKSRGGSSRVRITLGHLWPGIVATVCETPLRTDFQGGSEHSICFRWEKKSTFLSIFKVHFFRILKEIKTFSWVSETSWAPGALLLCPKKSLHCFGRSKTNQNKTIAYGFFSNRGLTSYLWWQPWTTAIAYLVWGGVLEKQEILRYSKILVAVANAVALAFPP